MAMNPHPYHIANPPVGHSSVVKYRAPEYFEMLGPEASTKYSHVLWHSQPLPLPVEVVKRYAGKVMAILGYEVDVVRGDDINDVTSAPCYELYNHHYSGWMHSSAVEEAARNHTEADASLSGPHGTPLPRWTRRDDGGPAPSPPPLDGVPHVQVFSEGNGNEHRRSFKGYPTGFAQLIQSPAVWANNPMVININKRLTGEATPGVVARLQPSKSLAPVGGTYNGILECPCTTRLTKLARSYRLRRVVVDRIGGDDGDPRPCAGMPAAVVETARECAEGAVRAGVARTHAASLRVVNATTAPRGCWLDLHGSSPSSLVFNNASVSPSRASSAVATAQQRTDVCRDLTDNAGLIVPSAPNTSSSAVPQGNFNADVCAPAPTSQLTPANNPICNFSWYGGGILCCGDGAQLLDAHQPVPDKTDTWRLKYRFYVDSPLDGLAARARYANAFRVWWSTEAVNNEYSVPASAAACDEPSTPASACVHTIRSRFRGADTLALGRGCMVVGDAHACGSVDAIRRGGGAFQLMYAAAHCHAPACLSMELWDDDTGELLCRNVPTIGTGTAPHDEDGFVVGIAPCLWGSQAEGLLPPPRIRLDGNYSSVKRVNATRGHWGVMALWQMRGAYL